MVRSRLAAVVAMLLLSASYAAAQNSTVSGRVANAQGGVVANAEATLRALPPPGSAPMPNMPNMPAAMERTATAGADGAFTFANVAAGDYVLMVDASGFERSSQTITVANQAQNLAITLTPLILPGAEENAAAAAGLADTQLLLDRIKQLEARITDLESEAVLSEPETRVKRIEVYVDQNNNVHDEPVPGARQQVSYQRERVYRRQTINEKLEQALAAAQDQAVKIGVDATTVTQGAGRTKGDPDRPNKKAYALASADLFFAAKLAQYTSFFADVVALSGAPPDREIPSLTLLNGYTARLVNQNELNLREAWLRTEFFGQRLGITAGRLDLTNYFDRNAFSNDETTQFISDALVNNQMLGLAVNGTGVVADYDPKNAFNFKVGFQQSNPNATSLSDSIYSLAEVGYTMTPFSLPEGHYRLWYRNNNGHVESRHAVGVSLDQKLNPFVGVFGRYGQQQIPGDWDRYWSTGVSFAKAMVFNPLDTWGVGFAQMRLASGEREHLTEGYYNFLLTERLRLSFTLQHVLDRQSDKFGYLLPGVRLQAAF
jgi:carboxypeptidase family protein/carbohydrate-selective porin (OprB family)